jgi:hypothetical protein
VLKDDNHVARALEDLLSAGELPSVHGVVVLDILLGQFIVSLPALQAVNSLLDPDVGS